MTDNEKKKAWFIKAMESQCRQIEGIDSKNLQSDGFNKMLKLASLIKGYNQITGVGRLDAMYYWRLIIHHASIPKDKSNRFTKEAYKMAVNAWHVAKPRVRRKED